MILQGFGAPSRASQNDLFINLNNGNVSQWQADLATAGAFGPLMDDNTGEYPTLCSPLLTQKVVLTPDQILALNSTQIGLVPALGADIAIIPVTIGFQLKFGTVPFGTYSNLVFTLGNDGAVVLACDTIETLTTTEAFLALTVNSFMTTSVLGLSPVDADYDANVPLLVSTADEIEGGDSTLVITVSFYAQQLDFVS